MRKWIALFIVFFIFIGAIPFFASHSPFKQLILAGVGAKYRASITADSMELSWLGPQQIDQIHIQSPDLSGTIESLRSSVPFWSLSSFSQSMKLEGGTFHIHAKNNQTASVENVKASTHGAAIEASGITKEGDQIGEFTIAGQAVNPALVHTDVNLTATATRMPTLFVDRLLNANGYLAASIGSTFDMKAKAIVKDESGSIDLFLDAEQAHANVFASFTPDSITLRKPLSIAFQITPQLSEMLLKNANPLFLTGVQSKRPAVLNISDKGFFCSRPYSLSKLKIDEASLDLGQIRMQNGPSLASLVSLLKSENLSNLRFMNAWFTPLPFSLRQGELHTGRMDLLLADSVHICTWGNIDLIHDRIDMNLGLPADTLASAFGLNNLPSRYMMRIPIRGTTEEPEIVTGPAAAKIAAMLAAQNIPKKAGAFGGLINLFAPAALDDSSDIPPAKRPFPWEK